MTVCLFLGHILTVGWLSFRSLICNNYNNTEKPHVGSGGGVQPPATFPHSLCHDGVIKFLKSPARIKVAR